MKIYTKKFLTTTLVVLNTWFIPLLAQPAQAGGPDLSGQGGTMSEPMADPSVSNPEIFLQSLVAKSREGNFLEALQELEVYLSQLLPATSPSSGSKDLQDKGTSDPNLRQAPDTVWAARFLFLTAYLYLQRGELSKSSETWNHLIARVPSFTLNDYAHYYLAESYRRQGRQAEALKSYQDLIDRYPSSLLQPEGQFKLAKVLALQKRYVEAVTVYATFLRKFPHHPLASRALWESAHALEAQGDFKAALESYGKLQKAYPYSFWAAQARKREKEIFTQHPELRPSWDDRKLYGEGSRLYGLSLFAQAEEALARLAQEFPRSPLMEKALPLLGKAQYSLRENEAALKTFEDFLVRYPQSKELPSVLHMIARIHLRREEGDKFLAAYQRLSASYPTDKWTLETLYLVGTYYEESLQDFRKALEVYNNFLRRPPRSSRREDALWRMAWIYYRSGEYPRARSILTELIEKYPNSYYLEEAIYWAGRASEKLGDWRKAIEFFQRNRLVRPRSYYGSRSLNRLAALFKEHPELKGTGTRASGTTDEKAATNLLPAQERVTPRAASASPSGQQLVTGPSSDRTAPAPSLQEVSYISEASGRGPQTKAQELMKLGLYEEAAQELEKVLQGKDKKRPGAPEIYKLLEVYSEAGDYAKSVQLSRRYFWNWLSQEDPSTPDNFWAMAYPLGYERLVKRYAGDSLDPFLVYAIIMAESEFNPEIRSPAGAVGLMQIMHDTGKRLAENLGLTSFSEEMLLNVELNIALGVSYLEELLARFKGDLIPAIASYNAGEDRVETWLRRRPGDDPEMFVANIPYRETKKYVQRVLWYYEEYQRIYGNR